MTYDQLFFINYAQVGALRPLPTSLPPHSHLWRAPTVGCLQGHRGLANQAESEITCPDCYREEGAEPAGFPLSTQEGAVVGG